MDTYYKHKIYILIILDVFFKEYKFNGLGFMLQNQFYCFKIVSPTLYLCATSASSHGNFHSKFLPCPLLNWWIDMESIPILYCATKLPILSSNIVQSTFYKYLSSDLYAIIGKSNGPHTRNMVLHIRLKFKEIHQIYKQSPCLVMSEFYSLF